MDATTTTGLVLRTRPLTETSLIVHWITPDLGRLATVAKGARRPNSPFRGKLDLLHLANFNFARSRRSDLHTLREVTLLNPHRALREDFDRLQVAAFATRTLELATESETPVPDLFQLLLELLHHLEQHPAHPALPLAFQARTLQISGLLQAPDQTPLETGSQQILRQLLAAPWLLLSRLHLTPPQIAALSRFLDTQFADAFSARPPKHPVSYPKS